MAMTKSERAELQSAIDRADMLDALRLSAPVMTDVDIPDRGYAEGWAYNTHTKKVWKQWSGFTCHGDGPTPMPGERHISASQGGRRMYSTKALALMAMRHELANQYAKSLMAIDREVAALTGSP